jgi:hypothetical protein
MLANNTRHPPIIVNIEKEGNKNRLTITETTISEYERITIFPP